MFGTQQFDSRIQVVAIVGAVALMAGTVELVRRRRLGEFYSIIWLALGAAVMILALFLTQLGRIFIKRSKASSIKFKASLFYNGISLLLILFSVSIALIFR